jgi:cytochrome c551/c552
MIEQDSIAKAMVAEWKGIRMPQQALTDQDIEALLAYIRVEEAKMASKK